MFDFGLGSSELLLVAIIALIVIGPKDLPRLLRTMGQYMRKVQGMAREFQNHLNEAAKETGVDDVKKEVKGMTNFTVTSDLDKQGAEIKKAIESSASKASPNGKADGDKTASANTDTAEKTDTKDEPAKTQAAKTSAASRKPAAKAGPAKSSKATPKGQSAAKSQSAAKAKPKPAAKSAPKPAAKAKPAPKASSARETAKS